MRSLKQRSGRVVGAALWLLWGAGGVACAAGTSTDTAVGDSSTASSSSGGTCMPTTEICDGQDNDCNGVADEGCGCAEGAVQACYTGEPASRQIAPCAEGQQTCTAGAWGQCVGEVVPATERCDGVDNDCDGTPDEFDPEAGGTCDTGLDGVCGVGELTCEGSELSCVPTATPSDEICDGLDNDCNGTEDDGDPGGGAECDTELLGVCAAGTETCVEGEVQCVQDVAAAAEEICGNGDDDDCNGTADDQCCAHSVCDAGPALDAAGCGDCVADICALDAFCCTTAWDSLCQEHVYGECGSDECGTCTNPRSPAAACGAGHHCVAQDQVNGPGLCVNPVGIGTQYDFCTGLDECAASFSCVDVGTNVYCLEWCTSSAQCPFLFDECEPLVPAQYIGAEEWGICYDGLG